MRKFLAIASIFLAFVLVGAGCSQLGQDRTSKKEPIKIGAIYPLSGPLANLGQRFKRGLEIAKEEINKNGGINGRKIKIIYEDNRGKAKNSVSALKKLTEVQNVKYIFTALDKTSKVTIPVAKNKDIVYITFTVKKMGQKGDNIFKDGLDMKKLGKELGKIVEQEDVNKLGILAKQRPVTDYILSGLRPQLSKTDFKVVKFSKEEKDFKTILTKIKRYGADGLAFFVYPGPQSEALLEDVVNLGLSNKKLFSIENALISDFMTKKFAQVYKNTTAIDMWFTPKNDKWKDFANKYEKLYGHKPKGGQPGYTYDDLKLLVKAIDEAGNNPSKVKEKMKEIEYNGVVSKLDFNEQGNSARGSYFMEYKKNEGWILYKN